MEERDTVECFYHSFHLIKLRTQNQIINFVFTIYDYLGISKNL